MTRSRLLGNPRSLLGRIPQRGWSEAVHGHWEVRLVEEAVAQARAALGLDSTLVAGHFVQGDALRELGRYVEAIEQLETALRLGPGQRAVILARIGYTYARWGNPAAARRILRELDELQAKRPISGYEVAVALVHCVLEEPGAALDWLERARAVDDPNFLYWLGQPHWDCVRTHPRFRQLRHEAGLGDLDIRSPA